MRAVAGGSGISLAVCGPDSAVALWCSGAVVRLLCSGCCGFCFLAL